MGSSPVTATTSVRRFFTETVPLSSDEVLGVAFSGGRDSLALLLLLREILGPQRLVALHVDHAVEGSSGRAELARALARRSGIPFVARRVDIDELKPRKENWEAAARRLRYQALAELADSSATTWIATAHHLSDQIETLLQRIRQGTDWMGLAGIRRQHGRWLRPALHLTRQELHRTLAGSGCLALEDKSNRSLERQRARHRHAVLPALTTAEAPADAAAFADAFGRLAQSAEGARSQLLGRPPVLETVTPGTALARFAFWLSATQSGVPPPGRKALSRGQGSPRQPSRNDGAQPRARFHGRGGVLWSGTSPVAANGERTPPQSFSYSFEGPGECDIPEIGLRLSLHPAPAAEWMFQGSAAAAGLVFAREFHGSGSSAGERGPVVEVRSRRSGDRLRVLGMKGSRRLKDLLIDRKIPAAERDRIPLLCHQGNIAWVPGVTVGELFRLRDETACWIASLRPMGDD